MLEDEVGVADELLLAGVVVDVELVPDATGGALVVWLVLELELELPQADTASAISAASAVGLMIRPVIPVTVAGFQCRGWSRRRGSVGGRSAAAARQASPPARVRARPGSRVPGSARWSQTRADTRFRR